MKCSRCPQEAEPGYKRCGACRAKARLQAANWLANSPEAKERRRRNNRKYNLERRKRRKKDPEYREREQRRKRARRKVRLATDPAYRRKLTIKHSRSPAAQRARERYKTTHAEQMKAFHRNYFAEWAKTNAERINLSKELRKLLVTGVVVKPSTCSTCGKECVPRAFLGALDLAKVTWHCPPCIWKVNQEHKGK